MFGVEYIEVAPGSGWDTPAEAVRASVGVKSIELIERRDTIDGERVLFAVAPLGSEGGTLRHAAVVVRDASGQWLLSMEARCSGEPR